LLIEAPVNLLPAAASKRRSPVRDAQRFLSAAALPRTERYGRWTSAFTPDEKAEILKPEFRVGLNAARPYSILDEWIAKANGAGIVDALMLTDQMTYLPNDLLPKVDIASMANSLEARSPFLDHKVIEFAASLPAELKMKGFRPKYLLKKAAARLVPRDVIYRRKMGFGVPIAKWLRGEMREMVESNLRSKKFIDRGIVDGNVTERYLDDHIQGRADHATKLWTLLMLELWYQRFIDGN
jgi:asparagine synthase (glutamine-hydrolysing)